MTTRISTRLPAMLGLALCTAILLMLAVSSQGLARSRPAACHSSTGSHSRHAPRACSKPRHHHKPHHPAKPGKRVHKHASAHRRATTPAQAAIAPTCEDGSTPTTSGEGSAECADGSQPSCEDGLQPILSEDGSKIFCEAPDGGEGEESEEE